MRWYRRLLLAIAIFLAVSLPLLAARLAQPASVPVAAVERAGLTLGAQHDRHVVVTSLRNQGPADRSGIAVGDELRHIAGQPVTDVAMARRLINDPRRCELLVDLHRAGTQHVAKIRRCGTSNQ